MEQTNFEKYFEKQLEDPGLRSESEAFAAQIRTTQMLLDFLDRRRAEKGINKSELARFLNLEPANVRRMFGSKKQNPSLQTLIEIADLLDLEIRVVPKESNAKSDVGLKKSKLAPTL